MALLKSNIMSKNQDNSMIGENKNLCEPNAEHTTYVFLNLNKNLNLKLSIGGFSYQNYITFIDRVICKILSNFCSGENNSVSVTESNRVIPINTQNGNHFLLLVLNSRGANGWSSLW